MKACEHGVDRPGLEEYGKWRETADRCVLEAFEFYGLYLWGQTNGWSEALSLPAVVAAFQITRTPQRHREEMTWMCQKIHSNVMADARREANRK